MAIIETKEMAKRESELHWKYTEDVMACTLANTGAGETAQERLLQLCGMLYKAAFEHGWKHAEEAMDAEG